MNIIETYVNEINSFMEKTSSEDIDDLFIRLCTKEEEFRKRLQSVGGGKKVYLKFVGHIEANNGGIKMARGYFRVRQNLLKSTVNVAIREVEPHLMYDIPINFRFCNFAMNNIDGSKEKLLPLFNEIKALRDEIISRHLYLSLNRAKVHKNVSYTMTLSMEELIQVSNEAMISAVDNFVINDTSSFHHMAIGYMISRLIAQGAEVSSATIGEHANKLLYRLRKLIHNEPRITTAEISSRLEVSEQEINDLLLSTIYKSLDEPVSDGSDKRHVDYLVAPSPTEEFERLETKNDIKVIKNNAGVLTLLERKVLRLKGIKI